MRAACALAIALAAGGCGDLFDVDYVPEGYACSAQNTCPPKQQCVPGEHVCRTPCTQTSLGTMNMGPTQNGQCQNINNGGTGTGYSCDYDHFCRPSCAGLNGTCGGCSNNGVCDTTVNICRPQCVGGCPTSWGCVDLATTNNGNSTAMVCAGCRPIAAKTFLPPTFAPTVFYDSNATPGTRIVAVADLAGDGHPSVVAIRGDLKIQVYGNDGMGGLMAPVLVDATTGTNLGISDVAIADLDHDGHVDVVLADAGTNSVISMLPGHGDGTLGALVVGPQLPGGPLAVGDFDGDGKVDVVMAGANVVSIVTGDGMGGLKQLGNATTGPGGAEYVRLGAYDFNGDGKLDLWADDAHGGIGTFLANGAAGSPSFGGGPTLSTGTRTDEALIDVDGDGKDDFAIATSAPTGPMGSLVAGINVATNNGGGGFSLGTTTTTVMLPATGHLVVADFDGDGHRDLALLETGSAGKSAVDFVSGNGSKLVYSEQIALGKDSPNAITTGDLDGDGRPDLVIALGSGGVAVMLNQTPGAMSSRSARWP